jgi:hypothetical protein
MERINDGDSQIRPVLAVLTARGIKKIPRSTDWRPWSRKDSEATRCRETSSFSATRPPTGSSSWSGRKTDTRSGTRSKRQTAPVPAPLQEFAGTPIISLAGLLRLAEWVHIKNQAVQGGDPCREADQTLLPPAPDGRSAVDARSTLESVDGRTASTNAGNPQRDRASTTRRSSRRPGGAR